MFKLNPTSKKEPPGGHHYSELGVHFRADNFKDLVKLVKEHRIRNMIPVGDPEQDVLLFYATHWPYLVKEDQAAIEAFQGEYDYSLWRAWIHATWTRTPRYVISKEAQSRWEKCRNCPFNKKLANVNTDEGAELTRRAFLLRRGMDAPDYLGFCSCHNVDLSAFSYFDSAGEHSAKSSLTDKPAHCWVVL